MKASSEKCVGWKITQKTCFRHLSSFTSVKRHTLMLLRGEKTFKVALLSEWMKGWRNPIYFHSWILVEQELHEYRIWYFNSRERKGTFRNMKDQWVAGDFYSTADDCQMFWQWNWTRRRQGKKRGNLFRTASCFDLPSAGDALNWCRFRENRSLPWCNVH